MATASYAQAVKSLDKSPGPRRFVTAQIATEVCGFIAILSGTFLLHKTKDVGKGPATEPPCSKAKAILMKIKI